MWPRISPSCFGRNSARGVCALRTDRPLLSPVDLLGWRCVRNDQAAVHLVVEALMRGRLAQTAWSTGRRWIWSACLRELRSAAVLLARLRAGHADLRFLAANIRASMG